VTMDVKNPGDLVYVLGITKNELGGSEYYAMRGFVGNTAPTVDAKGAAKMYNALSEAIKKGLVKSCHDCSDGGLGVALAESAFAGGFGMDIELKKVPVENVERDDAVLFSESQSRFVATVSPENKDEFENVMNGNLYARIGRVRNDKEFVVKGLKDNVVVKASIDELKEAWQKTLRW